MTQSPSWKQALRVIVPVVFIVMLIFVIQFGVNQFMERHGAPKRFLRLGDTVEDFTLTKIDESTLQSSETNGKVLFINFWASWCQACMAEMPSIVRLQKNYKS